MRRLPLLTAGMGRLNSRNSLYFSLLAGNLAGEWLAADCLPRQLVSTAEKPRCIPLKVGGKCPQFCVFHAETGLGESVLLELIGTLCGAFLRRADGRSGLMIPIGRMQCDHKPIVRRMRI